MKRAARATGDKPVTLSSASLASRAGAKGMKSERDKAAFRRSLTSGNRAEARMDR